VEYETYPNWVPNLDAVADSVQILLSVKQFCWFERTLFMLREFEMHPRWGATCDA